jgi:protein-tyrosine phosphatase
MRKDDYDRFDLIVAMDSRNLRNLRPFCGSDPGTKVSMLMQYTGEFRDVEDPWYTGDFAKCFDDILEGCEAFLSSIRAVMHDEL